MGDRQKLLRQSSRLLETFADLIDHRFDRQKADRILYESHLNQANKAAEDWLETVQSCAEALEFRIRRIEASLAEIRDLVSSGVPVAFLDQASNAANSQADAAADPESASWFLITHLRGRRLKLLSLESGTSSWLSWNEFQIRFKLGANLPASWLICYPVLMHDASSMHQHDHADHSQHHEPALTPVRRLLGILKAESGDIFVIVVFSIVVGLLTLTTPIAVEALVNTLAFGQFTQPVVILSFIVLVLLSFSSALTAISTYASEIIQRRLFVRLVEDLAYRLPRVEKRSLDRNSLPELTNRFLDIITIQKSVSKLLLDGLVIVLQTIIGMVVLAFYHPFLLGFDVMLLLLIAFTLFVLGRGAVKTAIGESVQKFQMLDWLEEIGRNPSAFRLNEGWDFAMNQSDHLAVAYLDARKKHFKIIFRQVIFALGIYCVATTVLLGLGGWLVISGELSLGQLVAAELIVILIVRSFAKLGKHMESFYDLMAAVDKVGVLLDLPMHAHDQLLELEASHPIHLQFENLTTASDGKAHHAELNLLLEPGQAVAILGARDAELQPLVDLCLGDRQPESGRVRINGIEISEYRVDSLRAAVGTAGRSEVFHGTLEQNVHLSRAGISLFDVRRAIERVGLETAVQHLPQGIHSSLETGGFPLSPPQIRRLMLARAVVSQPHLLIINQTLDSFSTDDLPSLVNNLRTEQTALLVFTYNPAVASQFDKVVKIGSGGSLGGSG